jgi:hypothetical protein
VAEECGEEDRGPAEAGVAVGEDPPARGEMVTDLVEEPGKGHGVPRCSEVDDRVASKSDPVAVEGRKQSGSAAVELPVLEKAHHHVHAHPPPAPDPGLNGRRRRGLVGVGGSARAPQASAAGQHVVVEAERVADGGHAASRP